MVTWYKDKIKRERYILWNYAFLLLEALFFWLARKLDWDSLFYYQNYDKMPLLLPKFWSCSSSLLSIKFSKKFPYIYPYELSWIHLYLSQKFDHHFYTSSWLLRGLKFFVCNLFDVIKIKIMITCYCQNLWSSFPSRDEHFIGYSGYSIILDPTRTRMEILSSDMRRVWEHFQKLELGSRPIWVLY